MRCKLYATIYRKDFHDRSRRDERYKVTYAFTVTAKSFKDVLEFADEALTKEFPPDSYGNGRYGYRYNLEGVDIEEMGDE